MSPHQFNSIIRIRTYNQTIYDFILFTTLIFYHKSFRLINEQMSCCPKSFDEIVEIYNTDRQLEDLVTVYLEGATHSQAAATIALRSVYPGIRWVLTIWAQKVWKRVKRWQQQHWAQSTQASGEFGHVHRKCGRESRDGSSSTKLSLPRQEVSLSMCAESVEKTQEMAAVALSSVYPDIRWVWPWAQKVWKIVKRWQQQHWAQSTQASGEFGHVHRKCGKESRDGSTSAELSLPRHQVSLTMCTESVEKSQEMAAPALSSVWPGIRWVWPCA